jgi:hypothetical protein
MRIDFTLTLPGLFEIQNIVQLAQELEVDILAKVVFSFSPDIILSPLALPRKLLDRVLDEVTPLTTGALQDVLVQLKTRPTFAEQWTHSEAAAALLRGKQRVLELESIRPSTNTLADILHTDSEIGAWYDAIVA